MRLTEPRGLRILDFDIENRPLSYWVPDMPTAEITAIASCWADDPGSMLVSVLTPDANSLELMLEHFSARYAGADIVTGHYIRMHDLPIINGALMEMGMPLLGKVMSVDTKLDMMRKSDVPATQEFLLETLDVRDAYGQPVRKFHMSQSDWREANRLTPDGIRKTVERVKSDVYSHMALRLKMVELGMLREPRVWNPGGGAAADSGRHAH